MVRQTMNKTSSQFVILPRMGCIGTWIAILLLTGCSSSDADNAAIRQSASDAYSAGIQAFDAKDYPKAVESFSVAISQGGLNPDSYTDAAVKLAVGYGATGKFDEAAQLLDNLERGAPELDLVYAARSYVLAKQGKLAESRAALAKARQYNRTVQEFKD
jgi:tetratricopeptide (TPR) repeat protein